MSGNDIPRRDAEPRRAARAPRPLLWAAAAVLAAAALFLCLWSGWREGLFLPRWAVWQTREFSCAGGEYRLRLKDRAVRITRGERILWESPEEIKVQDALSCDIDHDGAEELILLCWRIGRYGSSRPFWVKEDEKDWSQHIFVYEYEGDTVRAKWMSSYLGTDVAEFSSCDVPPRERPAAVEGPPRQCLLLKDPDGGSSRWIWDSWGFTKIGGGAAGDGTG